MTYPTDRAGKALQVGQRVRVKHCVGRYGQTRIDEGVITAMGPGGVTLDDAKWVTVDPRGYYKHQDFEHGHEIWTEIVAVEKHPADGLGEVFTMDEFNQSIRQ